MNAYAEIRDRDDTSQSDAEERLKKPRLGLLGRLRCLVLAALPVAFFGYLLATASLAVVLAAIGALLGLLGGLVAASLYVLDNSG